MNTNAHKRHYQANNQIKGTKSFKYRCLIKKLLNIKMNTNKIGGGLKSLNKHKPNFIYWDDPNELVDRLRLLISSESVGRNNHKNKIISIVKELREANIIK